jgi:hypothetical protein
MVGCTQPAWEQSGEMHLVGVGGQSIPIFSVILEGWQEVFGPKVHTSRAEGQEAES